MKKYIFLFLLATSIAGNSMAQNSEQVLAEGILLYRLEKAAWYGTDILFAHFNEYSDIIEGYVTYEDKNNKITCAFYSADANDRVLIRFFFDSLPDPANYSIDTTNNSLKPLESELIDLRAAALNTMLNDTKRFYRYYPNTSLNIIPIIRNQTKEVFVLTAPKEDGYVLIGNDYYMKFNKKNKIVKQLQIHNSLIKLPYSISEGEKKSNTAMHSHVVTDLISSTDICTLLLYKEFTEWQQHIVISKKYISIFDMEKEKLLVLTTEAWEEMYKNINNDN